MPSDVADYYDSNTDKFLPSHDAMESGAIHRRLYAPGVEDSRTAAAFANELILRQIRDSGATRILDLGCGVGGTIRYLERRHEAEYQGITISEAQVAAARDHGTEIMQADFLDSSWFSGRKPYDLIYAIESLQHNPDHAALSANLRSVTARGSHLVVIDDFARSESVSSSVLGRRFRRYWHAHGYGTVDDLAQKLGAEGFSLERNEDLSLYMRSGLALRLSGSIYSMVIRALRLRGQYLENIVGGNALLRLQRRGESGYHMLVFTRSAD